MQTLGLIQRAFAACCFLGWFLGAGAQNHPEVLKVLILDGRNNHDWKVTTDALKATLEATKRFTVSISTAPQSRIHFAPRKPQETSEAELKRFESIESIYLRAKQTASKLEAMEWESWNPSFASYDTVILNYNGPSWPETMRQKLVAYVNNGGGLILIHAANNGFRDWDAFNEMIGFGYNGHRGLPADRAPSCIKINDATGQTFVCCAGKSSGHGSMHPFQVKVRQPQHPIMHFQLPTNPDYCESG